MKREIVEAAGLALWAEVGLAIFVIVFIAVAIRLFFMSKDEADHIAHIPLNEETPLNGGKL